MLKTRKKRFERLLALRQRELDQRRAESTRATSAMRDARMGLEAAQTELRDAAGAWRVAPGAARSAEGYLEAGAWLQHRIQGVETAMGQHELAKERVRLTGLEVQKAEKAKRQIETLLERIAREQLLEDNRLEQKEQDELASRLSSRRSVS